MKINITYPVVKKSRYKLRMLLISLNCLFFAAGVISVLINLLVGGKLWCIVVTWSLWLVWSQIIAPDMIEYNRISQTIKLVVNSCILLALIDIFLAPGWAMNVVPMVCFSSLITVGILFFTDYQRQKQNMQPMFLLCIASIIGSGVGLIIWHEKNYWPLIVMGSCGLGLLIASAFRLRKELLTEMKKRFSIK